KCATAKLARSGYRGLNNDPEGNKKSGGLFGRRFRVRFSCGVPTVRRLPHPLQAASKTVIEDVAAVVKKWLASPLEKGRLRVEVVRSQGDSIHIDHLVTTAKCQLLGEPPG